MPSTPSLEKKAGEGDAFPQPEWQEGALSFLLLASAHQTGLLTELQTPLSPRLLGASLSLRLAHSQPATVRRQLLTLLFLEAVELRRTWDLRGYTGQMLALLTGRHRAYGYRHTERFLAELACIGANVPLTEALARWTATLWQPKPQEKESPAPIFYVDGHRKPVYADALIPRGLIGRTGKVLGCRALVVLHDQQGHPLLVTTHRGDQHLTIGLPAILSSYEKAAGLANLKCIVVDREGMAAEFLAALTSEGRTVVTILRTGQADALYRDLNHHQMEMERQGVERWLLRKTIKEEKASADAEIEGYQRRQWKAFHTSNKEFAKCEKYCREQRELLRALEDLEQQEREMYELDNRKDQIMTVCKVALANLGMWVRDRYFPASYTHASWHRLQPFFQLPGRIFWGQDQVEIELKPFNDRALNRDLEMVCAKVAKAQPRLPDGRRLLFHMQGAEILRLDAQEQAAA